MEIKSFIEKMAEQFDGNGDVVFKADTEFKKLSAWSSLTALSIMSMIDDEYQVIISGEDIVNSSTIQNLYEVVNSKINK